MKTLLVLPLALSTAASLLGCQETDECKQLKGILKTRKELLHSARAQAEAFDRVQQLASNQEAKATAVMKSVWLNEAEPKIQDTLEKRVRVIAGATIARGTTPAVDDPSGQTPEAETMWTIHTSETDPQRLFRILDELIATPPLVKFRTLLRSSKKSDDWTIEIVRASVDQLPINPQPARISPPVDLSNLPRQIGFCGAGKLRDELGEADTQLGRLREKAEQATVLLQSAASWEGLRGRAELARDTELENRRHVKVLRDAVLSSGVPLKALGVEGEVVFLEVFGGPKERVALEQALARIGGVSNIKEPPVEKEGVVRLMVSNTIMEARRNRQGMRPQLPGESDAVLPADHPAARTKQGGKP